MVFRNRLSGFGELVRTHFDRALVRAKRLFAKQNFQSRLGLESAKRPSGEQEKSVRTVARSLDAALISA